MFYVCSTNLHFVVQPSVHKDKHISFILSKMQIEMKLKSFKKKPAL